MQSQEPKTKFHANSYFLGFLTPIVLGLVGFGAYLAYTWTNPAAKTPTQNSVTTMPAGNTNSQSSTTAPTPGTTSSTTTTSTVSNSPGTDGQAPSPSNSTNTPSSAAVPTTIPVTAGAIRNKHGVSMQVKGIEIKPDSTIIVSLTAINGSNDEIDVNHAGGVGSSGVKLKDNLGNEYPFVTPENDQSIKLKPGATLKGDLAFRGPLVEGVTSLTFGAGGSSDVDSKYIPRFTFTIPFKGGN